MNKKALIAILVALGIPIVSYFVMRAMSETAVQMPRYYLLDSTRTTIKDGKQTTDSVWHTVADIRLVNQLGDTVHLYDIKNKVIVADVFFTSCGSICPYLTRNMAHLQRSFMTRSETASPSQDSSNIQFVSFSIDPERDSVERIKNYADRYGVKHDNWWLLTGNRDSIYKYIFEELHLDKIGDTPIDPNFAHTAYFVVIDRGHHVRGYYSGLDTAVALPRLAHDAALLMLEKDKEHPSPLPFDPNTLAVIGIVAAIIVLVAMRFLFRKEKGKSQK
ncbi:MAG: SCO family protein [Chitinophagaceae bacterium]